MKHYRYKAKAKAHYGRCPMVRIRGSREEIAEIVRLLYERQCVFENKGYETNGYILKLHKALDHDSDAKKHIPLEPRSLHTCLHLEQIGDMYTPHTYMWGYNYKTERRITAFEKRWVKSPINNNRLIVSFVLLSKHDTEPIGATPQQYLETIERELETGEPHITSTSLYARLSQQKAQESASSIEDEDDMPVLDDEDKESKPYWHRRSIGYGGAAKFNDEEIGEFDDDDDDEPQLDGLGSLFG